MPDAPFEYFRRGSKEAQAQTVFTNRVEELSKFRATMSEHAQWVASIDPTDPDTPRRNVLDFYGIGGIGKSSLVRKLQGELQERPEPGASAIIDLADASAMNAEDLILRIRTAVGELGVKCAAFDFALAYYWRVVHPGTTLEAYTRSNSALHRASERIGLSAAIESSVMEVISSIASVSGVVHGSARFAQAVGHLLVDRARANHAISRCAVLSMFLDPATVERSLTYMPSLLAWDLAQADNPRVVLFFDTFEELTKLGRATENLVQRTCYLLPNVLFVFAGRDRLDWDHEALRGTLDFVGTHAWPTLAAPEDSPGSACMLLGQMSAVDADRYLRTRLVRDERPAIPAEVRAQIIAAAEGWPLYLDIAVGHFQEALQTGSAATTDFGVPFPALVARIMTDLDHEERRVLRSASLFSSFDAELVHEGAGTVSRGSVQRLLKRSFVKRDTAYQWSYSLHSTLRAALTADEAHEDSWDYTDWAAAADRILAALGRRQASTKSRAELADCVDHGLRLAHRFDRTPLWLSDAGRRLAVEGALDAIPALNPQTTYAAALANALRCVGERQALPFLEQARSLETCLSPHLEQVDRFWMRALRADALLSAGQIEEAENAYREILADPPDSSVVADAKTMYALCLLKRGAYEDLERFAVEHADEVDAHRLRGDVYRHNAQWQRAREQYELGLARAHERRDRGLETLFRSELALVDGWEGVHDPRRWLEESPRREEPWSDIARRTGQALYCCTKDAAAAVEMLDAAASIAQSHGLHEGNADITVARAFVALVQVRAGEYPEHEAMVSVQNAGARPSWVQVAGFWTQPVEDLTSPVQWLGGHEMAAESWRRVLQSRRKQVGQ